MLKTIEREIISKNKNIMFGIITNLNNNTNTNILLKTNVHPSNIHSPGWTYSNNQLVKGNINIPITSLEYKNWD